MPLSAKYPKTPYWPWSPSIGRDDGVHPDPSRFVDEPVVVTENLDGGNPSFTRARRMRAACRPPAKASG